MERAEESLEIDEYHNKKLVINCSNVRQQFNNGRNHFLKNVLRNRNFVHTIVAHNIYGITQNQIFEFLSSDSNILFPMNITYEAHRCSFDVCDSRKILEILFKSELNLQIGDKLVVFTVYLECAQPSISDTNLPQVVLATFIRGRLNNSTYTLNMDNFQKHHSLKDIYFFGSPLKYICKQFLHFVFGHNLIGLIKVLKLSNNNITTLFGSGISILPVKSLDLRNNQIKDVIELTPLKGIKELWLDGNPLCKAYSDGESYTKDIKLLCPYLKKLDGVSVIANSTVSSRRNYTCSPNADKFADYFLEKYFTIFDNQPRDRLLDMYHANAMFSLTASYLAGQSTSGSSRLQLYTSASRNLMKLSDFSKSHAQLYKGPTNIISCLTNLPPTEHDPYTFTVDVVKYSGLQALLTVTGVFRHPRKNPLDNDHLFGFCRTFHITGVGNDKYQITNDILYISNASTVQVKNSFKISRTKPIDDEELGEVTESEREEMCYIVAKITGASYVSSRKCLEVADWNVKEALKTFLTLFKNSKINVEMYD